MRDAYTPLGLIVMIAVLIVIKWLRKKRMKENE